MAIRKRHVVFGITMAVCAIVVIGGWVWILIVGLNDWEQFALAKRGTFGDSFGVITALFTGFTLIGAAIAVYYQHTQLVEQRESEQAAAVENRFFQLLNSRQTAVNATRVKDNQGPQAIRVLYQRLTENLFGYRQRSNPDEPEEERRQKIDVWFIKFFEGFQIDGGGFEWGAGDLLGHLFRLTYQIVRYIDESGVSADDKKFYIRILRAHLSYPELVLLFYNAISHYGFEEFRPLIRDHNLLKNLTEHELPDPNDFQLYRSLLARKVAVSK